MTTRRSILRLPFWIYIALTLLVAAAALNGPSNLLVWTFGVMVAALLISGIASGLMMLRLDVRRLAVERAVAGEPMALRYAVRNRSRFMPAFNLHVEELDGQGAGNDAGASAAWIMHIGPRETVHGDALRRPVRRGPIEFDRVRVWTTFPLGIIGKSVTFSRPQLVLVHPRIFRLRQRLLQAVAPAGRVGTTVTPHAGAGDDYYGLREFRPGDSMRHVAWKRTANRDQLVCIERTHPDPPRVRVVLNLTESSPPHESAADAEVRRGREEDAISLAASIVHAADLAGLEIGLSVLGLDVAPIPVRRSHWHRNRVMAALAGLDLDAPRRPVTRARRGDLDAAGLVVVHPFAVDPDVVPEEAWHVSARRMDQLVERDRPAPEVAP